MVARLENWPMELSSFLQEKQNEPFAWGRNDCLTFVAQALFCITGNDYYYEYSGYDSEQGAKEILESHGGIIKIIEKHFGRGTSNTLKAGRGDIAIVKCPDLMAGIVDDSGRYIALVTHEGLRRFPLEKAIKVWRV